MPRMPRIPRRSPKPLSIAVPPALSPSEFERYEGFRETTLAYFTDPEANAALRKMGELQYTLVLEYWRHWPLEPEGTFRHLAKAGVADLRHLQGFFAFLAREREASELTPAEERLSRLCGRLSGQVREIADALEREIEGTGG